MQHTLLEIWRIAQVVLGISLVIFVHESGHFLMARLCKVRVEVFSLGFGPRLFGWRRGPTQYQLALVPLGGYVKMAGEEIGERGSVPADDELASKSVGQRFLIYSGGVLANVAFGVVVFPFILALGVPFEEPLLGESMPGSPAWHARLEPGTRVLSVNGNEVFGFIHIPNEVAIGPSNRTDLEVVGPGDLPRRTVSLTPVYSKALGYYTIGVTPALDPTHAIQVDEGSPAARAGLKNGDRLIGLSDSNPAAIAGLPLRDQLAIAMENWQPFTARYQRDGETFEATITPEPAKDGKALLGVTTLQNRVADLRDSPLVAQLGLEKDDRILAIDGRPILRNYDFLLAVRAAHGPTELRIERDGRVLVLSVPAFDASRALALFDDVALADDAESARVLVYPGSAAEAAGLKSGDRILRIDGAPVKNHDDIKAAASKAAKEGGALALSVERMRNAQSAGDGAQSSFVDLSVAPRILNPPNYGLDLLLAQYIYKTHGPVQAVRVGLAASWKFLEESWLSLKRILMGQVSSNNIGGIITIGVVSHSWASDGITKLFFFLCMLSMNLALLNVLPIPVLDGGHLFFLLIEKLKGSPVSERVLSYSQMVGIVLLLSLMVYVTFNDVLRWIIPK